MLDTVKAKPSVAAKERPALTVSPRDGRTDMRSGRKKASGGVEQKKWQEGRNKGSPQKTENRTLGLCRLVPKGTTPPTRPLLGAVSVWNFLLCSGGCGDIAANDPVVNWSLIEILYKNGLYGTILSYRELRRLWADPRLPNFGQATLRAMEPSGSTAAPSR